MVHEERSNEIKTSSYGNEFINSQNDSQKSVCYLYAGCPAHTFDVGSLYAYHLIMATLY